MKTSEILKAAKKYLNKEKFICYAIYNAQLSENLITPYPTSV